MFEYAVSDLRGTLLDYGMKDFIAMEDMIRKVSSHKVIYFNKELDIFFDVEEGTFVFRAASPDSVTGQ